MKNIEKLRKLIREEIRKVRLKESNHEVSFMAPKDRQSLQKYNEKLAKVINDDGSYLTIEFQDGKQLTNVPKSNVRYVGKKNDGKLNELTSEDEIEHQATNLLDYLGGEVEDLPNWRANTSAVEFFRDNGITDGKLASKIYQRAVQLSQANAPRPKPKNKKYLDN